jgi:hypothetical protein
MVDMRARGCVSRQTQDEKCVGDPHFVTTVQYPHPFIFRFTGMKHETLRHKHTPVGDNRIAELAHCGPCITHTAVQHQPGDTTKIKRATMNEKLRKNLQKII